MSEPNGITSLEIAQLEQTTNVTDKQLQYILSFNDLLPKEENAPSSFSKIILTHLSGLEEAFPEDTMSLLSKRAERLEVLRLVDIEKVSDLARVQLI